MHWRWPQYWLNLSLNNRLHTTWSIHWSAIVSNLPEITQSLFAMCREPSHNTCNWLAFRCNWLPFTHASTSWKQHENWSMTQWMALTVISILDVELEITSSNNDWVQLCTVRTVYGLEQIPKDPVLQKPHHIKVKVRRFVRENLIPEALRNGSHSFYTANTPCLYLVSVHQAAPPLSSSSSHLITAYYSFIDQWGWKAELA